MKVTHVSLRPTEAAERAGRPALTPELLAASGARYSRSNEGLEAILAKIDPHNLDKSVDSIFKMIDYGHQSIADMAPVAMFIDGVSMWLAYEMWARSATAGGQESSTRYIRIGREGLPSPDAIGIDQSDGWLGAMESAFAAYSEALALWTEAFEKDPTLARIPTALIDDPSEKAQRAVGRMKRNYAFDRARYFLPLAAETNVMLIMSARGWVQLGQYLLSHPLPEPRAVGEAVRAELEFCAPRLLKHCVRKDSMAAGIADELARWVAEAGRASVTGEAASTASLELFAPEGADMVAALRHHDNRYAWLGPDLGRTLVRFGWSAVAMGEIRDLNRHRTGTKHCPLVPLGFYCAADEAPNPSVRARLEDLAGVGVAASEASRQALADGQASAPYWALLGTQYRFEHATTADKFLYEAELRTGTGAHYRYAKHLRDTLTLWYERYPETRGLVLEGDAEPE